MVDFKTSGDRAFEAVPPLGSWKQRKQPLTIQEESPNPITKPELHPKRRPLTSEFPSDSQGSDSVG
jgi:hypothetical protein